MRDGTLAVLVVFALSGCLGAGPPTEESAATSAAAAEGKSPRAHTLLAVTAKGCQEVTGFFPITPDEARKHLPPGFVPADASKILRNPLPMPAGRVGALVTLIDCQSDHGSRYTEGITMLSIEAPRVAGVEAGDVNMYEVSRVTDPGPMRDALVSIGWEVVEGTLSATASGSPIVEGGGAAVDANGTIHAFSGKGTPRLFPVQAAHWRNWHKVDTGLAYVDYPLDATVSAAPGTCVIRPGTAAHNLTKATACDKGEGFVVLIPGYDTRATLVHLPGAVPRP